jgi:CelD/BcsL family acetyltransferase involved in cellulose biosynthesis
MADTMIIQMSPSDPRWISFLESNPDAGFFHHPVWSQLMTESYGYRPFVIALPGADGDLTAGVPLMEVNSPITGKRWVSLPFSDYCRPLYVNESALRKLVEGMIQLAAQNKILKLDLRGVYPDSPTLCAYSQHVMHDIDLRPGKEEVWKRIHQMHRRNIRIAQENDIEILHGKTIEHLRDFYRLHLYTRRRQGVPIQPWKFFERLKKLLLDRGHGFLLLAYKDQECIAGAIFLHWKAILTYKYGASKDDGLKYRPNNLVMWTAIQWGCDQGFALFDMGRTDLENTGLRTFKSRWGARETPLFYTSLGTNSIPKGEGKLMGYMHRILQKLPTYVCRLSGELLYKHFG